MAGREHLELRTLCLNNGQVGKRACLMLFSRNGYLDLVSEKGRGEKVILLSWSVIVSVCWLVFMMKAELW